MPKRPAPDACCDRPPAVPRLAKARLARTVAVLRALGDPNRLEIFRLIAASRQPICVCDVVDRFDLGQPTISHHLKVLREAGLVKVSRKGVWSHYAAAPRGVDAARKDVLHLLARSSGRRA
jgi:ArsR family transcriptional regulator